MASVTVLVLWMLCAGIAIDLCAGSAERIQQSFQNIDLERFTHHEFATKRNIGRSSLESGYHDLRCIQHLDDWRIALNRSEWWAMRVSDAIGKPQSGILSGNLVALGNFDQCVGVQHAVRPNDRFEGQYCLMHAQIDASALNMTSAGSVMNAFGQYGDTDPIHRPRGAVETRMGAVTPATGPYLGFGICAPATCSPRLISAIADAVLSEANISVIDVIITPHTCQKLETTTFDGDEKLVFAIFGVIALLMIASTLYDLFCIGLKKEKNEAFTAFSVYTNGGRILSCDRRHSPDMLSCLHGIRALSTVWVLYGHTHTMISIAPVANMTYVYEWIKQYQSMLVLSSLAAVDTFFFMSGMLLTWSMLKQLRKSNGKMNFALLYIHRYLRLTPLLGACILIAIYVYKHLGNGPLWQLFNHVGVEDNCRKYWWSALLYIQNYYNPDNMCVGHSWYLSVDMQLFIASPPFIYLLYRFKHKALVIPLALCFLSIGLTVWFYVEHNLTIRLIAADGSATKSELHLTYYATHSRMGAWMIGVLFGYVLYCLNGRRFAIRRSVVVLGWIASLATMLMVMFANYPLQQVDHRNEPLIDGLYDALSRVAWPMALGFIIFTCHFGYGGPVNTLLSLPQWQPLSRLTYAIYLMHLPTILLVGAQIRTAAWFSQLTAFHSFIGFMAMSTFISFWMSLAFESPVVVLEKLLFHRRKEKPIKAETNISKQELILNSATGESTDTINAEAIKTKATHIV